MRQVSLDEITGQTGIFSDGDWVESKDQDPQGDVRLLQLADIGDGSFLNKSNRFLKRGIAEQLRCTFLKKGDLLIARMPDPIGRACIFPGLDIPCVTVVDVCIVRPDNTIVNTEWLKFQINATSFRNKVNQYISGSTRQRISRGNLSKIKFKLPPLSQQIKIASILSKVETLIRQRKENMDLLDEFLKSTFLKMFHGVKGAKTTLGECCVINPVKSEIKDVSKDTEVSFIPMASVSEKGDIDLSQTQILSNVWTGFTYFKDGDVVFAKITPSMENGKGAIIRNLKNGIGFGTTEFHVLRPIEGKTTSEWIYHLTKQTSFRELAERNMTGTAGQKRVPSSFLENYTVTIPSIALQSQFANIIEKTEIVKSQFRNSLSDLENLYDSLSQQAFKGELDLSAIEIDETMLPDKQKVEPVIAIPPGLQQAIELSKKINKQFEGINRVTKVPSALTKQLEQWNKLEDQFKHIPKLPEALLQAQKNIERIQEAIGKAGTTKLTADEETGFNWAVLASRIKERYKNRHFNFEMLYSFIQKDTLAEATPYYASEELKANPRLNDSEDLKSFIQTAIQNIEMDEKQQRQTNPFLRLTQSFYNAEEENFTLSLHKDDFKLIKDKTARQRSGIYFSLATEA